MNAKRDNTLFNRADLLWAFSVVENNNITMAELLGFEAIELAGEEVEQVIPINNSPLDFNVVFEEVVTTANKMEVQCTIPPRSMATVSAYYRVVSRQREKTQTDTDHPTLDLPPDWFSEASPTILQETTSRIPAIHQVKPLHTPLMQWARLLPLLQRLLGQRIQGRQVDIPTLVRRVVDKAFIRQIPRKQRHGWAQHVRILIDINEQNFPYRRDFIQLCEQLKQARGDDGLEIQYLLDEPGGYIARYNNGQELIEAWQAPARGTPLLILSDMGRQIGSRRILVSWLVFGQLLKAQGVRPTVLMPVAERQIDPHLLKYFDCIVWDRNSSLKRVKGLYQAEYDSQNHAELVEQLLRYCFAAVRVDSGLLRAIRDLLPVRFDIGHETAVWQHSSIHSVGDEWGWQVSSKSQHLTTAWQQLVRLPQAIQEKLVESIGRYHALYPDELYFEAMYALMMLGLPVPAQVRIATDDFLLDTLATYRLHPEDMLLDGWVKRYLARYEAPAMRREHRYWLAFMAFSRLHELNRQGTAEIAMPAGLTEAEQEKILGYVNESREMQAYVLRQIGETLELLPAHAVLRANQEDEWGRVASVGAHLLSLNLRDTRILHNHHDTQGKQRLVMLDLAQTRKVFTFPPTGQHEFQIGNERLVVEVKTAQQREPWMKRFTAGSQGLRAESLTGGDYYWHPPQWDSEQGMLRGFWYYLPPDTTDFKPDWAQAGGRDQYGVYADVDIAGVRQRFRWIEPTTFIMGSPKDEDGHFEDEIQHEVSLTQGYWMAETVCTQVLWYEVMDRNPSEFQSFNNPIENISWNNVTKQFLRQVNQQYPKLQLRLPTEAEWENACRAGTTGAFNLEGELSLNKINYRGTWDDYKDWGKKALQQTAAVKSYPPNQWGLYEMHGNVWEWCEDWYGDYLLGSVVDPRGVEISSRRVLRGGAWFNVGRRCRSTDRSANDPSICYYNYSFRLARNR